MSGSAAGRSSLATICSKSFNLSTLEPRFQKIATQIEHARQSGEQIPASTEWRRQGLSHDEAYKVAAAGCRLRMDRTKVPEHGNQYPIGRKIGFTNKSIWPEFNIDASIWGYMYGDSVFDLQEAANLSFNQETMSLQPKIEPEIVLGIKSSPSSSMSDAELLDCIEWIAHGFEMVQSVYPDWKFTSAETIAIGALHQCLLVGQKVQFRPSAHEEDMVSALGNIEVELFCNDKLMDRGGSRQVLGHPLNALRHLCMLLETQSLHPRIQPGEVITTGTMTRALSVAVGDTWRTTIGKNDLRDVAEEDQRIQPLVLNIQC